MSSKTIDDCENCTPSPQSSSPKSKLGLYMTIGIGAVAIGSALATVPFLTPAMRKHALPYIPATPKQIENVFKSIREHSLKANLSQNIVAKDRKVHLVDLGNNKIELKFPFKCLSHNILFYLQ